jgi:tetratricopeptide (TPR) repeat protein
MLSQQKFKEAEKIFKWCLKINRDNRFARSYLGVVYASLKMPEKAIKTWKKVLEGSVFEPYTLVNLSRLYLIMGNYEKSFSTAFEVVFTSSKIEPDLRRMASQILDESEKKLQSDYQFKDPLKYKSFNRSFKRFRLFCMLYFKVKIKNISSLNSRTRKDIIDFIQNLKDSGLPLFFINFINDPEAPVEFKYLPLSMGAEMLVFKNEDLFGKLNNAPSLLEALGLKIIDDAGAKEPEIEKPEDHEDDLMQSVQENPDDPWAHYKLGVYFMDKKEYDKAIGFFDEVTRLSPENSMAYHAKGAALSKMGNYKEASAAFQRAIVSTPGDSLRDFFEKMNYKENIAYFDLGDTYAKMDMLDDAIKMFEKGLESDAKIPLAHFQLGVCYSSRLEHEKAVKSFENVIFLQPSFTPAYVRLGLSQMHLEKYDKAIKALTLATRVNPLDQEALVALGQAYLKKEEINMAIRCFGAAASVGPETDIGKAAKQKAQELLEGKI